MRLDRITDGNRWLTYEISNISYMFDPREAIEELGSVIAGDNREAYTIEYAHYSTTNYGTYSYSSFDAFNSGECFGYSMGYGYRSVLLSPYMFLPSYGFGFGPVGCNSAYGSYGRYGYYGYPVYTPTAVAPPIVPPIRPRVPIGGPVFHSPRSPGDGAVAVHRPHPDVNDPTPGSGSSNATNSGGQYRRPGLIAEDAPNARPRGQGRVSGGEMGVTSRPTIQQMIGSRRIDEEGRALGAEVRGYGQRAAAIRDGYREPSTGSNNSWSSATRGGTPHTAETGSTSWSNAGTHAARESGRSSGGEPHTYSPPPRGEGSHAAPARSEPRSESPRSAPAHSEPARSAPAPASSSSGSQSQKKP